MDSEGFTRRKFLRNTLTLGGSFLLAGCDQLSQTRWLPRLLGSAETLNSKLHHLITPANSMAKEYTEADLSPVFRSNGTSYPPDSEYDEMVAKKFMQWHLQVDGLVEQPLLLSLAELRAFPARTQITRHDCVEGWSAIGKWKGVPLGEILRRAAPRDNARYAVFYCVDSMAVGEKYYESVDIEDAFHPQTILAYDLNDEPLPIKNGAPLRLRVERQLGYKSAKYLMRIELVEKFDHIAGGNGGYWEDHGYEWYAGI